MSWRDFQVTVLRSVARGLGNFGDSYVWLVFCKDLQQPLVPVHATLPITITQAIESDAGEMAAMWSADDPAQRSSATKETIFRARFRGGSVCLVARVEGRIVAYDWIRPWTATGAAGIPMVLADGEVYTTDAYTSSAWRGRRIHPALNYAILKRTQDDGFRIAYTMARADNAQSLPTLRRLSWTPTGTLLIFEPKWAPDKPLWFVLGSPYPMPVGRLASARVPSLAEFHAQQQFEAAELLHALPWSNATRLRRGDESFDLTIVPREHAADLRVASVVARAWPETVPAVVACNYASESWMLTRDPGGTRLANNSPASQMMAMLEAYASLQARAAARADVLKRLPAAQLIGLVDRLLEFLEWDADVDVQQDSVAGATFFIGRGDARRARDALDPCRAMLAQHLEPASRLPLTLNHGNLQPFNAALAADGSCVLLDWTWAISGPAGLSLHALVGECLPATVLLPDGAASAGRGDAHPLIERYLCNLALGGYAQEGLLRQCLPASITAGIMLDVLRLAGYPMEDPAQRRLVGDRLTSKLSLLLDLCAMLEHAGRTGPNDRH